MSSCGDEMSLLTNIPTVKGHEFFCQVDEKYIEDEFNLFGLDELVPHFEAVLKFLLEPDTGDDKRIEDVDPEEVDDLALKLYGLIHARYILTKRGIAQMVEKYKDADFGQCQRINCELQHMLPIGLSDTPEKYEVKRYCPKCKEVYETPRHGRNGPYSRLDGAYFGTGFPHMFFMVHPEIRPKPAKSFEERLYGFRIHHSAYELQYLASRLGNPIETNSE